MSMGIFVNTDHEMSADMRHILTMFEFHKIFAGEDSATDIEVRDFIRGRADDTLANQFRADFLTGNPSPPEI